ARDRASLTVDQSAVDLPVVAVASQVDRQQDEVGIHVGKTRVDLELAVGVARQEGRDRGGFAAAKLLLAELARGLPLDRVFFAEPAGEELRRISLQGEELKRLDPFGNALGQTLRAAHEVKAVVPVVTA